MTVKIPLKFLDETSMDRLTETLKTAARVRTAAIYHEYCSYYDVRVDSSEAEVIRCKKRGEALLNKKVTVIKERKREHRRCVFVRKLENIIGDRDAMEIKELEKENGTLKIRELTKISDLINNKHR